MLCLASSVATSVLSAQVPPPGCPAPRLPLYSHNDYRGPRPLSDAIEAGFRGVEADVFLVDGELRVGHSLGDARRGPRLADAYITPLDSLFAHCERAPADASPRFLLLLEVKDRSPATHDSLMVLLSLHPRLFLTPAPHLSAVEVVLVGWTPPLTRGRDEVARALGARQYRMRSPADTLIPSDDRVTRLVSVDYGKRIGRWWRRGSTRRRWLTAIGSVKRRYPHVLVRAHNVPADAAVMARLFAAGVDLVGATDVASFARALEHVPPSGVYQRR
jgi:hypothetical protein